jgi:tetratricopeptide (TPR) repeat protein
VLVAAAAALGLLAHDLRAWPAALHAGDVRAAAGAAPSWQPSTALPRGWSEGILGVSSQRALRLAILDFRRTYGRTPGLDGGLARQKARDEAEAALAAASQDGDPARAAQALDLLGLLLFGDSTSGNAGAAQRALGDLQQATRLDPGNGDAQANLELVERLLAPKGSRPGSAAAAGPRSTGRKGGGGGTPGEGY